MKAISKMKKFINSPATALTEAIHGMAKAHPEKVRVDFENKVIFRRKEKEPNRVALLSGGGSGHEPMHGGFVGKGMLDAACCGEIFTSPTPDQMMMATEEIDTGAGVLYIVKNYAGDIMNFEMASEMSGPETAMIITDDDVALYGMGTGNEQGNRGVAGTVIVEKIVGALAERGADLASCVNTGREVNANTGSMAVALRSCTVPAIGEPTFNLGLEQMEVGVGIHGEAGRQTSALGSVDEISEILVSSILEKLEPKPEDPLLLFCNGLGATPLLELYTLYNSAHERLAREGYTVVRSLVGPYCTALDMAGASLSISRLTLPLLELWDDPVSSISLNF